ncbi:MAG: hypothetical protein ABIM32_03300, partial [candidate division WOR-3 bacterium]
RELNNFFNSLTQNFPFSLQILKLEQTGVMPPKFLIKTSKLLKVNELKYIENKIREHFGLMGTPIILENQLVIKHKR